MRAVLAFTAILALAGCDQRRWSADEIRDIARQEAGGAAPNLSRIEGRLSELELKVGRLEVENASLRAEVAGVKADAARIEANHESLNGAHNRLVDYLRTRGL